MQFVDRQLAARLESSERVAQICYAEALRRSRPDVRVEIEEIGGGHMVFTGPNSPIGRAIGLGLRREVVLQDIERVERFYFQRGADAQIDVVPAADESLFEIMRERPYRLVELNNVVVLELGPDLRLKTEVEGIEIRRAQPSEARQCADVLGRCFHGTPPDFADTVAAMFQGEAISFLALARNTPVAVATGLVIKEEKLMALFGAGTLPLYRGRGIQTALLSARIQAAKLAGCDLAITVTRGGTTSQRNAERLGFRVAYSKATMIRARE
ncbi:MAG TPA: GNAT family N-acetyltransferase [Terriglobales bacterium]|nr:GNAT family N-acetyltransferase [Terriglobales bacterium]